VSDWNLPREGACRCGQVRMRITAAPLLTAACHCTGCQRMTGSAFSLSVGALSAGFEVTEGDPVIGGLHGDDVHHYFCPRCMSWMFTRPQGFDWFVNVRATLLDNARTFTPFIETYTSEKLPWVTTPAVHRYEKFPLPEDYGRLIEEFTGRPLSAS
jgi:hypothetical protein